MIDRVRVVVVGGGLSGLFTAVELLRRGVETVVFDAGDRPGGVAETLDVDGYAIEPAAGAVAVPHPHLTPLLTAADVELRPAVDASLRHVLTGKGLVAIPPSPQALLAPVVPWTAKLRAAAEPLVRTAPIGDDETLATFLRRRFGYRSGAMLATLMASGVYAGDPERLSAHAAFPSLTELEDAAGSVIRGGLRRRRQAPPGSRPATHLPVGGMRMLTKALAAYLGDGYRGRSPATAVARHENGWVVEGDDVLHTDHVVVTSHPLAAGGLVDGELAELLGEAKAAPVAVVALGGKGATIPAGFGYLVGSGVETTVIGCLFESSYAPDRAPAGHWLVKAIVGGARRPEAMGWSEERLLDEVTTDVGAALGTELAAEMTHVIRHRPGIPQYQVGHRRWLAALDRLLGERPGLHLGGWAYRGVGVSHLATDAVRIVNQVLSTEQ